MIIKSLKLAVLSIVLFSCNDMEDKDEMKPEFDLTVLNAFPTNCASIRAGEDFQLIVGLKDNNELGSFSVDIHNNFDGHSHSTEEECHEEHDNEPALAENPFTFMQNYPLENGLKELTTNISISIPSDVDKGSYHVTLTVVDKTGWQTLKILSVHIE